MKIALYIEDGLEQIVLTPQSTTEVAILDKLHDKGRTISTHKGGFYKCQGGWVREGVIQHQSTILVVRAGEAT